jgi:RimJ/RimL family protein N-acetyltransferase
MFDFALSETITLRPLEEADADAVCAAVEADRAYLAEWMPWAAGSTLERVREFIRGTRRQLADNVVYAMLASEWGRTTADPSN